MSSRTDDASSNAPHQRRIQSIANPGAGARHDPAGARPMSSRRYRQHTTNTRICPIASSGSNGCSRIAIDAASSATEADRCWMSPVGPARTSHISIRRSTSRASTSVRRCFRRPVSGSTISNSTDGSSMDTTPRVRGRPVRDGHLGSLHGYVPSAPRGPPGDAACLCTDGRIILLEHGRSDVGALAKFQEWRSDSHYEKPDCRWTQEPLELVDAAGLHVERARTAFFGMITMIVARPASSTRRK